MRVQDELEVALALRGFTTLREAIGYAHRGPDVTDIAEEQE